MKRKEINIGARFSHLEVVEVLIPSSKIKVKCWFSQRDCSK